MKQRTIRSIMALIAACAVAFWALRPERGTPFHMFTLIHMDPNWVVIVDPNNAGEAKWFTHDEFAELLKANGMATQ